ncbi:hypothetical protein [Sphingomonas sp. GC_Shp_1]|nr:hypothetical protein [Sphingomonas sp. GC_Shp_1]
MTGVVAAPPRRIEALAYIVERIQRSGTSPSYGEIGLALEPRVVRTRARQLVDQLVELGLIERPPASRRGIRIRDLARCRQVIGEALGQRGCWIAQPLGALQPPHCTIEQLPLLPLIVEDSGVH